MRVSMGTLALLASLGDDLAQGWYNTYRWASGIQVLWKRGDFHVKLV